MTVQGRWDIVPQVSNLPHKLRWILLMVGMAAADDFVRWWPQFQAATVKRDTKAIARGVQFPLNWENSAFPRDEDGSGSVDEL